MTVERGLTLQMELGGVEGPRRPRQVLNLVVDCNWEHSRHGPFSRSVTMLMSLFWPTIYAGCPLPFFGHTYSQCCRPITQAAAHVGSLSKVR